MSLSKVKEKLRILEEEDGSKQLIHDAVNTAFLYHMQNRDFNIGDIIQDLKKDYKKYIKENTPPDKKQGKLFE